MHLAVKSNNKALIINNNETYQFKLKIKIIKFAETSILIKIVIATVNLKYTCVKLQN